MSSRYKNEKVHYIASTTFTLDSNFSDLKVLGKGSYGVVASAFYEKLSKKVAIKKVTPVAKHIVDAKHVLREMRLLRYMGRHENIITLEDLFFRESQDELYLVMELMDSDLHHIIQSKQSLTEQHFQHFMYQLFCGLKFLHDHRIIHRDLKPGNLLVSKDCRLRITDFGLARERPIGKGDHLDDGIDEPMTEHVVTRWYRPPELMLCPDGLYTYAVDIWSCGCIFAEMLGRSPIFPGKNFVHQLTLVFDVLGSPKEHEVDHITNAEAKKFLREQSRKAKIPFHQLYPSATFEAIELLDSLLAFDPSRRLTVDEIFQSLFLHQYFLPKSYKFPELSEQELEFSFERKPSLSRTQLKALIQQEVSSFKREKLLDHSNPLTNYENGKEKISTAAKKPSDTGLPEGRSENTNKNSSASNIPSYYKSTSSSSQRSQSAPKLRPSGGNIAAESTIKSTKGIAMADLNHNVQKKASDVQATSTQQAQFQKNYFSSIIPATSDNTSHKNMVDIKGMNNFQGNSIDISPRKAETVGRRTMDEDDVATVVFSRKDNQNDVEFQAHNVSPKNTPISIPISGKNDMPATSSPARKSIVATYTSPKRLVSHQQKAYEPDYSHASTASCGVSSNGGIDREQLSQRKSTDNNFRGNTSNVQDDITNMMENIFRASWQQKYSSIEANKQISKQISTEIENHTQNSSDEDDGDEMLPRSRENLQYPKPHHTEIIESKSIPQQQEHGDNGIKTENNIKGNIANRDSTGIIGPNHKKKLTVPKSPKFSTMSRQKRLQEEDVSAHLLGKQAKPPVANKTRAISVGKTRPY